MFPNHDAFWTNTLNVMQRVIEPEHKILAPKEFEGMLDGVETYPGKSKAPYQWVIVHKGRLEMINQDLLLTAYKNLKPIFANPVFVVLTSAESDLRTLKNLHTQSFHVKMLEAFPALRPPKKKRKRPEGQKVRSVYGWSNRDRLEKAARNDHKNVYLGEGRLLSRVLGRYLMYLDTREHGVTPHLAMDGFWESWVTLAISRKVYPGFWCVDVGAHLGYYSLLMADLAGEKGRVMALEPNPRSFGLLRKTVSINGFGGRIECVQAAAYSKKGKANLVVIDGNNPSGSLKTKPTEEAETFRVDTIRLDALLEDWPRVDFIKIDAEGVEPEIFRGLKKTIAKFPDLIIALEFSAHHYKNPTAFLDEIEKAGFRPKMIAPNGDPVELERPALLSKTSGWDMLVLQRD
jgi:FkbM family methyltransferase